MTYKLPDLDYKYDALEPYIDAKTMEIHHTKHHQTYIAKLNESLEKVNFNAPECPCELIHDLSLIPDSVRMAVRNNGGGHVNHAFFWQLISPDGGGNPVGALASAIDAWGGFDKLKVDFKNAALNRFGSGWVWLCVKKDRSLCICSTPNQDNPLMNGIVDCPGFPVLGLDLWEHAYYLNYQNRRPDYVDAFWSIVDWKKADSFYQRVLSKI